MKKLIVVNGKDKTDSITSYKFQGGKCNVVYQSSPRIYSYNAGNVRILECQKRIEPQSVIFKGKGRIYTEIEKILDYGEFICIMRKNRKDISFRVEDVEMVRNCLVEPDAKKIFQYFCETAEVTSLKTINGINILSRQYQKISAVDENTVLANYLNPQKEIKVRIQPETILYPFGMNQSQKVAVERALTSQISIIQGPPGTGKTQTILNIIANVVRNGKTVAVVSNNNSATKNVEEKLGRSDLSFISAFLGSLENKERFIENQSHYPYMREWEKSEEEKKHFSSEVRRLSKELNAMLNAQNRIAEIERELLSIRPEQFYFNEYYKDKNIASSDFLTFQKFSSKKLVDLWLEYEEVAGNGAKTGLFNKLLLIVRFSPKVLKFFQHIPQEAIPFLQNIFYKTKIKELTEERAGIEEKLKDYQYDMKMAELTELSMILFKAELASRYKAGGMRFRFEQKDFRGASEAFVREYPVILSTTYSIKGTLSTDYIYDYLIIDEASQVDLATAVLAFSCAKNVVVVGDLKQLPNVCGPENFEKAERIWSKVSIDERYHFTTQSLLSSACQIWKEAPSTLLREHYRCHPKIAIFFNQKFYDDKLIVMTKDKGESAALAMYRTVPGNHARGHLNQRQIDVIKEEILPLLQKQGYRDIGIVAPYNEQVDAMKEQLDGYDIATVHKFQGREKAAMILSTVDNQIGDFVDDPHMLNVAVSRAISSLTVLLSDNPANRTTNYGELARYIEYNNCQIITSKIHSAFDLLYKQRNQQRQAYLKKHKRVSEFDSENLAYSIIEKIIQQPKFSMLDCVMHTSLATIVKDYTNLTEREFQYASNPLTHIDFLIFDKMDKMPILAIEIDGVSYHREGSKQEERDKCKNSVLGKCQIPLLRIRTDTSGEEKKIVSMLEKQLTLP